MQLTLVGILIVALAGPCGATDFFARVVEVHDGDSLTVIANRQQIRIRIADIDAPESRQPFGQRSKQSLSALCFNKQAQIQARSKDRYGRVLAAVNCAGKDSAEHQIMGGMAWVFPRYAPSNSPLYVLQDEARASHRGLWADPHPLAPWEWRPPGSGKALKPAD